MALTLKDVAKDLGLSIVTVSKVLRNHSDVSAKTRKRVLKRIEELDYHRNPMARGLVTGRSYTVGLVVPDLLHPWYAEIAKGLCRLLRKQDYGVLISSSEEDPKLEREGIEHLLSRRVDALIVASSQTTVESFRRIEGQKTPYVLIDRKFAGLEANFVGVDDELIGQMATEHLIDCGRRRIAHIRGPQVSTAAGRLDGYRSALIRRGLAVFPGYIVGGRQGDEAGEARGYEAMQQLLRADPPPDAVFCYNDPVAIGAMQAIWEAGLRIPQDIAVIGCGNVRYGTFLRVPLSSIDQNSAQLGVKAAQLTLRLMESAPARPKTVVLQPKLVIRASTQEPDGER